MELQAVYLETPPEQIAYIKFVFESYEEVGIIRTVDRKKAIIVLLVVTDFVETARQILNSIRQVVPVAEISRPTDVTDDWLMSELANKTSEPQP